MRRNWMVLPALLAMAVAAASPALGQDYRSSVGWSAGALMTTSLNEGAASGGESVDLKPGTSWTVGIYYDHWLGGGHVGVQGFAGLGQHTLPWTQGDRSIYLYVGDLALLLRPAAPEADRTVLPYLVGGAGVARWGLGSGPPTTFGSAGATYDGSEGFQLTVVAGLGIDFVTPWQWGEGPLVVRVEGRNHMQLASPFDPANPDDPEFGLIHNVGITLGFHTGMGSLVGGR